MSSDTNNEIFEEVKVCSPEIQRCDLIFCPPPSSQDPELYHFMVTTAKAALGLHIPNEPLLVYEHEVQ